MPRVRAGGRLITGRLLRKKLGLSPPAAALLCGNRALLGDLLRGCRLEVCVLGVWFGDWSTKAGETLLPEEIVAAVRDAACMVRSVLSKIPAVMSRESYPYLHAVLPAGAASGYGSAEEDTAALCIKAAREITGNAQPFSGLFGLRVGLAMGTCAAGIILPRTANAEASFVFLGRPVTLCRMLAAERNRAGYAVLMDDAFGKACGQAEPADFYRTPGYTEIKTLYGMIRVEGTGQQNPRPDPERPRAYRDLP